MMDKPTTIHQWHELTTMLLALQANITSFIEYNHTLHPDRMHDIIGFSIAIDNIYILVTELEPIEAINSYGGYDPEILMPRLRERIYKIIEQTRERLEVNE